MTATTNLRVAQEIERRIAAIPGLVDAHLQQEVNAPEFYATIDRTRAAQLGLNANQIASNINISLSSSEQVSPNFWTDPASGIPYYLAVQTPEPRVSSINDLVNTPVSTGLSTVGDPVPGMLSNVADPQTRRDANERQSDQHPAGLRGLCQRAGPRSRPSASDIDAIVADLQKQLAPGNSIQVVGQIQSMNDAFRDLSIGLLFAAVFVYLLMVVNYQNFG